ncbi:MAG: Ni/Fe-hydrogenase cytochrome b subunit [Candidatus Krumholzibacteriia bacterium]
MTTQAAPVGRRILTPGVYVLLSLMLLGGLFAVRRLFFGIGSVTALDDQWPWGIWIAVDVASGVALAAGGFTTAALAHVFNRRRYHALVRPALLTAMLGYTFAVVGLMMDLGRWYNVWHPLLPSMWSGHSVLFEVGICVMCYLTVLYIEFGPVVVERFRGRVDLPGALAAFNGAAEFLMLAFDRTLGRVMAVFIIAGVLLSCLHQSSLGALMVIVPYKMDPLWHTPILPLLFLLSAVAVGFPMVILESIWAARSFGREPETDLLGSLSKIVPVLLLLYLGFKVGDMAIRGTFPLLFAGGHRPLFFGLEVVGGVVIPLVMFMTEQVRRSPQLLLTASLMVVLGVVLNRINVFLVAYDPVYATRPYFPSFGEVAVTAGLVAGLLFAYRVFVTVFPVLPAEERRASPARGEVSCKKRAGLPLFSSDSVDSSS